MLAKATARLPHGGGARFEADTPAYRLLKDWIAAGTPWGDVEAAPLAGIQIEPAEQLLLPDQTQQLRVTARYSDGRTRDVTDTAEYWSNQPADLSVSFGGLVKALGPPGESIATVRYQGRVAVARFTNPYHRNLSEQYYSAFSPANVVDQLVLDRWRKLGIAPSVPANDAEFLRRASLDAIGTLPTPDEVRAFVADTAADKRERLVDRLLERPEYARFWGQRWGDLLRNKQTDGSHKENSQKFAAWIQQAFADNMPFDRFARELITVTGKLEDHPQMDWYRQINNPQNRVEDIAQAFLGLRVSCANCHNHPFEHISQQDYWQFAAFFARVDAIGYGPVKTVMLKDEGAINNPRTGQPMTPKPFGGADCDYVKGQDARQKLVDWMVARENPYFARAVSNRLVAHYFKRGLVEAVDDLRATNPPSNPVLLDALAKELIDHGYDLKYLTRLLMKSHVYGLSAQPTEENRADTRGYARHYPVRLAPHVLLDAIAAATGVAPKFREFPQATRAIELPNEAEPSDFLDIFGRARRETPCACETKLEPSLSQVLFMMFAPELQQDISNADGTVARMFKDNRSAGDMVTELYLRTFSRSPTPDELHDAIVMIESAGTDANGADRRQAVQDLLWTLLNSKEFLFNH